MGAGLLCQPEEKYSKVEPLDKDIPGELQSDSKCFPKRSDDETESTDKFCGAFIDLKTN